MMPLIEKMSLKGRSVLITGAAGGLGKIIAETLAELGATLILVDKPGSDMNDFELKIQKKLL
jgi:NAD(P)-dependent dehydrogenase (short-subunit alcohol dehydrogenase family)